MEHRRVNSWKRLFTLAFITYLGAIVVLMFLERMMLFPAPSIQYGDWQAGRYGAVEDFVESTGNSKVHVWTLAKTNAEKTLIFCHGNGESIGFFPIRLLMRNQFRSIDKIPSYTGPLLQMHGDVDKLIPYRFGKKLFDACPSPRKKLLTILGLHHNDMWPEEFWDAGKTFIDGL